MQRDDAYLLDMLNAARRAVEFCRTLSWEQFQESQLHQYAVFKAIEIIGEAGRIVSETVRAANPQIPWNMIAGIRNRLIHEYFRIDLPTVWATVKDDLPPLIAELEVIVPPERA